jgi:hypothetical protein
VARSRGPDRVLYKFTIYGSLHIISLFEYNIHQLLSWALIPIGFNPNITNTMGPDRRIHATKRTKVREGRAYVFPNELSSPLYFFSTTSTTISDKQKTRTLRLMAGLVKDACVFSVSLLCADHMECLAYIVGIALYVAIIGPDPQKINSAPGGCIYSLHPKNIFLIVKNSKK